MQDYRSVIILGAPRSGTNMLRDVLTGLPGFSTWDCDEINFIWRHGNIDYPTDELPERLASPAVRRFVRRRFDALASKQSARFVVEKTCANSLRQPFVDAIVPEARYLFVHRHGMDAVASALKRWSAPMEPAYLLRKARFVPVADIPHYALRFARNRLYRLLSGRQRLARWGPEIEGMQQLLEHRSLAEVCAAQWRRCVELSLDGLEQVDPGRWLSVRYEDFVREPRAGLESILEFLEVDATGDTTVSAVAGVRSDSVGKGRVQLDAGQIDLVNPLLGGTLARLGYPA